MPNDGSTLYWRVKAGNSAGWSNYSSAWSFINGTAAIPQAPTLVTPANGATVNGTTVNFGWSVSSGATSYWIQISTNSSFTNLILDQNLGNYTGDNNSGMPNDGSTLYWRIKAGNSAGWGSYSSAWSFTNVTVSIPQAPTLITPANGATVNGTTVNFGWSVSSGATSYWIQISTNSSFTNLILDQNLGNYTGDNNSGMPNDGSTLYWRIKAGNSAGWSNYSSAWSFINGTAAIPQAPTLVTPANGATVNGTTVNFAWSVSSGATSYWIQISTNSSFTNLILDQNLGNYTGDNNSGMPNDGSTLYWRIKAGNSAGWGSYSSAWSFINGTAAIPQAPTLVTPANGATVNGTTVNFAWSVSSGATSYWIQISTNSSFTNLILDQNLGNYTGDNNSGMPNDGSTLYWRIKAGNSAGWSNYSSAWSFINGTAAIPQAPTLVTPANGATVNGTTVNFAWSVSSGATSYWIQISTNSSFTNLILDQNLGNYTGDNNSGMPNDGSTLYWRVKAGNSAGWSNYSSAWSFINGTAAIPQAPTLVTPANGATVNGTTVNFAWSVSSGATSYWIQISTNSSFTNLILDQNLGNYTGDNNSGMPNDGSTLYWRVKAGNSAGWGSYSSAWSFINGKTTIPPTPALSSPSNGSKVNGTSINLSWNASSGANDYWLQVSTSSNFSSMTINQDMGNYLGATLSSMPNDGSTFYWRVKAGNTAGWSSYSGAWSFINGTTVLPQAPTLLTPANEATVSGTSITFGWDKVSGATEYWLQMSTNSSFSSLITDKNLGDYTSATTGELPNNWTTYYWRVKAGNIAGWGNYSTIWTVINAIVTVPQAPALLTPSNNSIVKGTAVNFTWNSSGGATEYWIQTSTNSIFTNLTTDQNMGNNTNATTNSLPNDGTTYYWRV